MARGTLDAAAAAAAEWAGIKIVECPLCGAVMEAEQFRIGDSWRCEDCGAIGKVIDDRPPAVAEVVCPTCLGTKEVPAVNIDTGDETETVPCPDCQIPTISPLNPGEETGDSAGQTIIDCPRCGAHEGAVNREHVCGLGDLLPPLDSWDEPAKVFYEREGRMPSPAERLAESERLRMPPFPPASMG